MPGPMPYYLEKGSTLELIESFLNDDPDRLRRTLGRLRATNDDGTYRYRLTDCGVFDSDSFSSDEFFRGTPLETAEGWKAHLNTHWFGLEPDGSGEPAADFAAQRPWWLGYWGDTEAVAREIFVRAIECAFRVPHGAEIPPGRKPWPIELFWKCGQAWFEGWLMWRRVGDCGLITVLLATPAELSGRHDVAPSPIFPDDRGASGYSEDPGVHDSAHSGMFVVTHRDHVAEPYLGPGPEPAGNYGNPDGALYHGIGEVVAVSPARRHGGTALRKRTWEPRPDR